MALKYRSVGIVARVTKAEVRALGPSVAALFDSLKVRYHAEPHVARALGWKITRHSSLRLGRGADLILSLGGDGTLLRGAKVAAEAKVPILGVNLGLLGFLTSISRERLSESLTLALKGGFRKEPRTMLECRLLKRGKLGVVRLALNDLVFLRGTNGKLAQLEVSVDGRYLSRYRADGLIISTATGSTAYALSAGGPIMQPSSRDLILAPISPHALTARPLVLSSGHQITVQIPEHTSSLRFSLDGNHGDWVHAGEGMSVRRRLGGVTLLVPPDHDFFHVLRQKLGWKGN